MNRNTLSTMLVRGLWARLVLGSLGIVAAVLVPFLPVLAKSTTVTWPQAGRAPVSTTAFFVPYAPEHVHLDIPCSVVRAGQQLATRATLASSALPGRSTEGFAVTVSRDQMSVLIGGREIVHAPVPAGECSVTLDSDATGTTVRAGTQVRHIPDAHVKEVFAFTTGLSPQQATGLHVTAQTSDWFANAPSAPKLIVITAQLLLVAGAFAVLAINDRGRRRATSHRRRGWARLRTGWLVRGFDAVIVVVLGGWTVLGPVTPDDGFASVIAGQGLLSGDISNYYRWENSSEAPFTLAEHVLEPFAAMSTDPMVLRLPSVLAGLLTWLALSRGVMPVLLPRMSRTLSVRALIAVSFLAWWLPFGLGTRPEALTALGSTVALACVLRGAIRPYRLTLLGLGAAAAGLATAVSPAGLTGFAPFLVLAPQMMRQLRRLDPSRPNWATISGLALLASMASVGLVAMFADQSWFGASRATELHQFYGPNVPWFQEILRYDNLLGFDLQGAIARRVPVLLTLAMLVCTVLLLARGSRHLPGMRLAHVAPACFALDIALLWLTPSKWTHYFGAFAGVGATALVCSIVLLFVASREPGRATVAIGLTGAGLGVLAAALSFAGKNNWFLYSNFGVLWGEQPLRPLNTPLLWLLVPAGLVVVAVVRRTRQPSATTVMIARAPAVLACVAITASVAMLLVSFSIAPIRQHDSYSPGGQNLATLSGKPNCGLMDKLVATPDAPNGVLAAREGDDQLNGFVANAGFTDSYEPPDPPETGESRWQWGSLTGGALNTGSMTSRWFDLPALRPNQELALSVAGRTGEGNTLTLEFARSSPAGSPRPLGARVLDDSYKDPDNRATYPTDHILTRKPQDNPAWRSVHLDPLAIPPGADRVRVHAVDATTDPAGWIAVTGPRIRNVVPLSRMLGGHGNGPTYVDWSMAWFLPCARDLPRVSDGLAQTPSALLNPPDNFNFAGQAAYAKAVGGSFAGVDETGSRAEVPTRLLGTENNPRYQDWGHFVLVHYPVRRDAYDVATTWTSRWGWQREPRILPPLAPNTESP